MSMHFSLSDKGERPTDGRAFRLLVIGDFSGRSSRGVVEPLAGRSARKVDLDSFDALPGVLGARVRLASQPAVEIPVGAFDDLHPDEIYDKAEVFGALRTLRTRAADPGAFERVAEEVRAWASEGALGGSPASQIEPKPSSTATPESEFAALLGGSVERGRSRAAATVDSLIRRIVAPHVVPDRNPRQDELLAIVEKATGDEMRSVLHDPAWMDFESAWRGLHMLVTGLELRDDLTLSVLDASPAELEPGALESLLVTRPLQTAGGEPWSLIVHLHRYGEDDAELLEVLAPLAHRAGAPLLSGVGPGALGVTAFEGMPDAGDFSVRPFEALRETPAAEAVCLTAPRFLLRRPYGRGSDETERFGFEEVGSPPAHESLLWGNGAVLVAMMLGRAFGEVGWDVQPVGGGTVDDLPVIALEDGTMVPCAEAWLSDRAASAMSDRGVTPLVSVQNRGAVKVGPLRSLAGGPLACRWG
ncbi:MAG TPA: hypothetical protein ENK11_02620 [Phycisphaerales bacterium]|nr:hypothetical protein [Phycisphaerales bacterium]